MSNRWTIKEINETDDLTFAMCIVSERRETLNQEAPLAKKLNSAFHALEELRDICRANKSYANGDIGIKEAIYRYAEREYTLEDIKGRIENRNGLCISLSGLETETVLADKEMMDRIVERVDKLGCDGEYWDNVDYAIEHGIADVLEQREDGDVNP